MSGQQRGIAGGGQKVLPAGGEGVGEKKTRAVLYVHNLLVDRSKPAQEQCESANQS